MEKRKLARVAAMPALAGAAGLASTVTYAEVPTEVKTELTNTKEDVKEIGVAVLLVIVVIMAFMLMRRAMK